MQEEVFVVLAGTLTVHLGEDEVERHELAGGSVLERGDTIFLDAVS